MRRPSLLPGGVDRLHESSLACFGFGADLRRAIQQRRATNCR
jgi:hypothetical protein